MADSGSIVFVVDDDDSLRRSLERLLRVDLRTMRVQKYGVPGMATAIARLGDQLYIGTSDGISVLGPDGRIENYFVDIAKNPSPARPATRYDIRRKRFMIAQKIPARFL